MAVTPNMNLILPTVSVTSGPEWADLLNSALTTVDAHDHTSGKGIRITPSGLNINTDLPVGGNNITGARSIRLSPNMSALALPTDLGCVNNVNGDLYWNNGSGAPVQITSGGSVIAASDGISRSFETVTMSSNTTIQPSDAFSFIGVDTSSSVTITLPAASGVSVGRFYEIKDISGLANTNNITIEASGDLIDGSSDDVSLNLAFQSARLTSNGSGWSTNLAPKMANGVVTRPMLAPVGQQISSACDFYTTTSTSIADITNLSVTITTTGRPVYLGIIHSGANGNGHISAIFNPGSLVSSAYVGFAVFFYRDSTQLSRAYSANEAVFSTTEVDALSISLPPGSFWHIDTPSAGTYTFKVRAKLESNNSTISIANVKLIAYEL